MNSILTRLKKALYIIAIAVLLFLVFVADVVRASGSVDIESGVLNFFRDLFIISAFILFYLLTESLWKREQGPAKKLGFVLVLMVVVVTMSVLLSFASSSGFDEKNYYLLPLGFDAVVLANIFGVTLGISMIIVLLVLRDIILWRRRTGTKRNLVILIGCILATSFSTMLFDPLDFSILTSVLFGLTVVAMLLNSFRLSWIVYLSKREKLFSMGYGFFLFAIFVALDVLASREMTIGKSLLFYSPPLKTFVSTVSVFGTIYFGMTFLSTMFHLPTAEAFDRKTTEVTSLHTLSRLITQVLDFNELVESVTRMTLEVCQAKNAWLEVVPASETRIGKTAVPGSFQFETVARSNISVEESSAIVSSGALRESVIQSGKPLVIDDAKSDKRTKHLADGGVRIGSLVLVPLRSHDNVVGILYATKDVPFGFDQEEVDLISAFADQATIAIDNSRLIGKSLERERLVREMMVAQEMQKRLLPQNLPDIPEIEIEAFSTPAFEVGGDYYDFIMLDEHHVGVIVGDVSGKGVSAAFYMAEMKGIFQSLSKIYRTPKEFLAHAHRALADSIDKRSFISVVYAVLDLRSGCMSVSRAGHCPLLYVSKGEASYVQPLGMGLGMGNSDFFEQTIAQEDVLLGEGDVAVLFTDGVTEARRSDGDEYGYERLHDICRSVGSRSAMEIRDAIIQSVDSHMNHQPPEDDLTLIVIKWRKERVS